MPQKMYSLHLGVNYVDEKHYRGGLTELPCCSSDAMAMKLLMEELKYDETTLLVNEDATTKKLKSNLTRLGKKLSKGDLLVITYSGHGGLVTDHDGDEENGGDDSTWCLYDRQLVDDELPLLWGKFKTGVNIFLIMDACHSGSSSKEMKPPEEGGAETEEVVDFMDNFRPKVKSMRYNVAGKLSRLHRKQYKKIAETVKKQKKGKEKVEIKATVQLISACQDSEEALTGFTFSQFTNFLLSNLGKTKTYNTYEKLFKRARSISKKKLKITPNWYQIGAPSDYFSKNRPFIRKGARYPRNFKKIYDILEEEVFSMEDIGFGMDGLIIDAPSKAQKSIARSAKSIINQSTKLSKSAASKEATTPIFIETKKTKGVAHPWDQAYNFYGKHAVGQKDVFIEPSFYGTTPTSKAVDGGGGGGNNYLVRWPQPKNIPEEFVWHLSDSYSQLARARNTVLDELSTAERKIRIGHFDSGYIPEHSGTPEKVTKGISFVKGEENGPAFEKKKGTFAENEFHGAATLALLAGKKIKESETYGEYEGYVGAIPFAEVIPVRISDTVALIGILNNTRQFAQAIDYAIKNKCEVITMSMGGQPHRSWAKAINRAYEAGITIVTAAGNNFTKGAMRILPKKLIYPARFDRVIAATGITFNGEPYAFEANTSPRSKTAGGEYMQGSFGPKSAMETAIAAYTPNVPWAEMRNGKSIFLRAGGGTSSATPQVAAAAAIWIVKHRKALKAKGYAGTWKQVEAVRHALFSTADRSYPLWRKYYGQGSLKAFDALSVAPPPLSKLKKSDRARVTPFALLEFIQLMILRKGKAKTSVRDNQLEEMVALEMLQILHKDTNLHHFVEELDLFDPKALTKQQFNFLFNKVKTSEYASNFLKKLNNGTNIKEKPKRRRRK